MRLSVCTCNCCLPSRKRKLDALSLSFCYNYCVAHFTAHFSSRGACTCVSVAAVFAITLTLRIRNNCAARGRTLVYSFKQRMETLCDMCCTLSSILLNSSLSPSLLLPSFLSIISNQLHCTRSFILKCLSRYKHRSPSSSPLPLSRLILLRRRHFAFPHDCFTSLSKSFILLL